MSSRCMISSSILSFRLLSSREWSLSTRLARVCSVFYLPRKPAFERNILCFALKYSMLVGSISFMLVSALNCYSEDYSLRNVIGFFKSDFFVCLSERNEASEAADDDTGT